MSLLKIITPDAQDFGEPTTQLIKVSSRGLLGDDRQQFVKRASAALASRLDSLLERQHPDEPLVHLLAVGSTEQYGSNRNGDGFKKQACQAYHPTFVKHARLYRDHANKNPAKSYGRVVDSWFNDRMGRIELVCGLNATEKTAKANGGMVADREMEKLAQRRDIPVSMACKVAYDVCSSCGNKAPTKEDYCAGTDQGGHCKAGGLRDRIGQLVEIDGGVHQLHADNPHPCFFDISHVIRPADRIAYVSGLLEKAAADKRMVKSAELAAAVQVGLPLSVQLEDAPDAIAPLIKLAYACLEATAANTDILLSLPSLRSEAGVSHPEFRHKTAQCFRALSDRRICLPLPQFLQLVTGQSHEKTAVLTNAAAPYLAGAFDRLTADPNLVQRLATSPYQSAHAAAPGLEKWANDLAPQFSYEPHYLVQRAQLAAIRSHAPQRPARVKAADDRTPAAKLAEEYALYQLAYLGALPKSDLPLTVSLLKLQNDAVATNS